MKIPFVKREAPEWPDLDLDIEIEKSRLLSPNELAYAVAPVQPRSMLGRLGYVDTMYVVARAQATAMLCFAASDVIGEPVLWDDQTNMDKTWMTTDWDVAGGKGQLKSNGDYIDLGSLRSGVDPEMVYAQVTVMMKEKGTPLSYKNIEEHFLKRGRPFSAQSKYAAPSYYKGVLAPSWQLHAYKMCLTIPAAEFITLAKLSGFDYDLMEMEWAK